MIYVKKGTEKKLLKFNASNTIIVADFDATITTYDSKSSWSILTENGNMEKAFYDELNSIYKKYAPFELDMFITESVKEDLMAEWSKNELETLFKYKYKEDCLLDSFNKYSNNINFRKGVKTFLKFLNNKSIPIYIVSAGIGNVIELFLKKNNCFYNNINIISNNIIFNNGEAVKLSNQIINVCNKNVIAEKILEKNEPNKNILLFGDVLQDTNICGNIDNDKIIKIGFFEKSFTEMFDYYKAKFDIVCTNNTNALEVAKIILGKDKGVKYLK